MPNDFLKFLPIELKELEEKDFIEPPEPIPETGEIEVGILDSDLKKIYTLWHLYMKRLDETVLKLKYSSSSEREELRPRASELYFKTKVLEKLFWVAVNDTFKLWERDSTGVRKGWKVTWSDKKEDKKPGMGDLPPFLRYLIDKLGGDFEII